MNDLQTWVTVPVDSDFSIYNIPFGIGSYRGGSPRAVTIIGDQVIDLARVAELTKIFSDLTLPLATLSSTVLNDFIALGKTTTSAVREIIQTTLCDNDSQLRGLDVFYPVSEVKMHMPVFVRDYTDFYSSIEHATNVGKMFRDPENALLPNWKHLPVGYHGRASSIVVSGTDIVRPSGQLKPADATPVHGPTQRLDFELEMAFVVGKSTELGQPISIDCARDHIFGMVLFNDWSARDIQKWEYVPLGPFLGKSFASSVSPWIVTLEALDYVRVAGPEQDVQPLPYLSTQHHSNYDINLEVDIENNHGTATVARSNYKYMYWDMAQQLTHHTVNGCNVNVGDMMASGTISGHTEDSYGSMLELSWAGKNEVPISGGETRKFIADYDTVIMRGYAQRGTRRVGFGKVAGRILPAS